MLVAMRADVEPAEAAETIGQAEAPTTENSLDTAVALHAARRISEYLIGHPETGPVTFQGELTGGDALSMPREAAVLLARILGHLANGESVDIVPGNAEFTIQQAADFLGVSRPRLIELLDDGEIEYRRVGAHRRIRFQDLRAYRAYGGLRLAPVPEQPLSTSHEPGE